MNLIEVMDYIDADVAYLLGLITGRGRISESGQTRQIIIEFPYQALHVEGTSGSYNANTSIRLGLQDIRERLLELTGLILPLRLRKIVLLSYYASSETRWYGGTF